MMAADGHRNPYAGFGKIVRGDRLVGREADIDNIVEMLRTDSGSIAVIGNPRIGKTSVVIEALSRLRLISQA
jgi:hypothetical protein